MYVCMAIGMHSSDRAREVRKDPAAFMHLLPKTSILRPHEICQHNVCMYVCMCVYEQYVYIYFNEWRCIRELVRLGFMSSMYSRYVHLSA